MARRTQDTFAQDAGIDLGDDRAGIFDEFHCVESERMRAEAEEDLRVIRSQWHTIGVWKIAAYFGWGMFAIACLSRIFK